jgi:cysteine synthase
MQLAKSAPSPRSPLELIGHTPLVELKRLSPRPGVRIFAKLEGTNPTGSIKDRIARRLIDDAEARGELRPGMTLVEASTGNTAIALAMIAKQRGYRTRIILPHGVVPAVPNILETLGVEIHWCPPEAGTRGAIDMARCMAEADPGNVYAVQQFSSCLNIETHYHQTGAEIVEALDRIDVFIAGIGTGGTIMGCGKRIRESFPKARIVGLEPQLGECLQGLRRIEDSFMPPLLDLGALNGRWIVTAADSLNATRRVALEEGLLVGVSAGASLHVAFKEAERLPEEGGNIVCMFSDSGWKYLPAQPWQAAAAHATELDEVHWW